MATETEPTTDTRLVQLVKRWADHDRVPIGDTPTFEFRLEPNERIVGVAHAGWIGGKDRKTEDHYIHVWVAVEL